MGTPNTTEQDPLASLRLALADQCVALDFPIASTLGTGSD